MPSILFVHENYPAQFGHLADHLLRLGWQVIFATASEKVAEGKVTVEANGLRVCRYKRQREPGEHQHHYLVGTERAVLNGQSATRLAISLRSSGFEPDVIVTHSGWGSGSFLKVVWPNAKLIQYLEWWYYFPPMDAPEAPIPDSPEDKLAATLCRNLPFLLDVQSADVILSPTNFQAGRIPDFLQPLVQVQHDGIDTDFFSPAPENEDGFQIENLPDDAPVVTYATRGMEPLRGFPQFMEAASVLQEKHTDLHIVIAGNDRVSYGAKLPDGDSYKKRALAQHKFDHSRLHFVGLLPRQKYRDLLRRSDVHVYLTRPFVLSWSMIEAMSCGCALVATDNEAIREIATQDVSAKLVDMDDIGSIVRSIGSLLSDPKSRVRFGNAARKAVAPKYSSQLCHDALTKLISKTAGI